MAKFSQDFRTDCILVHASRGDMMAFASRYLKISADEVGQRLMWLKRQPDSYKRRVDAQVKLMGMKVKAKLAVYE